MNKLSSMQKLWLPLSIGLIALLCITIFGAYQSFQVRMEERKNDLTNVAHAGMSIVRDYASLAQKGVLPTAEAQKQALERLRSIRYGEDGYILVINSKPVMLMHPIQPGLVGHDMANDADADGRHHYVAFVRAAQAANGGFVDYVFAHARGTVAVPKIGYVLRFAPWDWILSTGAYVDDIDAAFTHSLYAAGAAFAVLALLLVVLVYTISRLESRTSVLADSLAEANQELTYLALHDSLTKLPNRVLLEDRLNQAIQNADRENGCFALMFMDLDGFKVVNDAYGHHVGDVLLVEVAQRIGATVRAQDAVARIGGDEFVLLAGVDEPADAATLAGKLLTAIREPFQVVGHELRVSTSIGIAIYPGNATHQHDLLTNADAAMYHAKSLGRNAYCFFEASMNADVHDQLQLVQDLRSAFERRELILHYQPKFTAPSGPVIGVEALMRWAHPTRGLIAPEHFIPLAEKTGLIVPIGEWVLDEACRQMRAWRDLGCPDWTMAVNLSPVQFSHAGLIQMVRNTLERYELEPRWLTLEITESTAMRDVDASLRILQQLHDMGVRISIDDFGTGYSSLLHLKRLPASELKIDRGFIRDLARDTEDAAIVSAIVALGQTLNLEIVAEGVETTAQQEFLTRLGCDSLQGFLLGRPMSADRLMDVVSQNDILNDLS
ncbi:MAG: diguanylate cyclase [Paraburkholderia sp.]|nr:diguanylate cyclase [Paraburkholderia sp.]